MPGPRDPEGAEGAGKGRCEVSRPGPQRLWAPARVGGWPPWRRRHQRVHSLAELGAPPGGAWEGRGDRPVTPAGTTSPSGEAPAPEPQLEPMAFLWGPAPPSYPALDQAGM